MLIGVTDAQLRRGFWRAPLPGINLLVLGMELMAGFGLLMVVISNAEGWDYLVILGAFLFFEIIKVF